MDCWNLAGCMNCAFIACMDGQAMVMIGFWSSPLGDGTELRSTAKHKPMRRERSMCAFHAQQALREADSWSIGSVRTRLTLGMDF
jgi:hypothetical protein